MTPLKNQFKLEEPFTEKKLKEPKKDKLDPPIVEEEILTQLPETQSDEQDLLIRRKSISDLTTDQEIFKERFTSFAGKITTIKNSVDLADDAEILILPGSIGWGFAMIGDNQEYGQFTWTSAGVVTLIANSGNTVNTDTDAKFCIYDAGSGIAIKNRLGSTLKIRYELNYR